MCDYLFLLKNRSTDNCYNLQTIKKYRHNVAYMTLLLILYRIGSKSNKSCMAGDIDIEIYWEMYFFMFKTMSPVWHGWP